MRPSARAAAKPADVRSRIIARSNSAKAPTICIIIRPAGVVVSMFSVIERKPAPALPMRSMMCSTSLSERDRRSSFQTTTVSPSRKWSSRRCSSGRLIYTHVSGHYGPFYRQVISATMSEAPYVLDGLLHHVHQTDLRISEHYTDTAGATDHVFGLCHLLGYRFAPRIKDLKDRKLYTVEKPAS